MAGQFWAATDMQCSDMTSMIGNNVASMVFDAAKAVNRVTITVYQSAAGNGILTWLSSTVDRLISSLGNAIYFPYLAPVILLGVMWLAWHGLIRKRATRTIEGTIWMVVACAAAIWLIGRPADFTGFGQGVSNGVTQILNVAFSKLPNPGQGNCVPVHSGDPQSPAGANFGFTQGNGLVDQNANELWSVLVCKPWLDGEFGTTQFSTGRTGQTPVNTYGRQLLWAQAIAANETPTAALIKAKQSVYSGIAASIKQHDPGIYPLFQGKQWTSRLEIGFAGLFAALVAGVLVLLIAITLIILKLGFLLLLIAGPFFLIVGTHPGFGRVVATRWFEMLVGVLLKSVAVAIVLSVLLYAYSLIMGTSDAVLPWALKILMIALVTIAVFIYRKPFQHLFSAVGYGSIGARERAELEIYRSREVLRRNATGVAAAAVGGFAGYRASRWARRGAQSTVLAEHIALAAGSAAPDGPGRGTGLCPAARAWPTRTRHRMVPNPPRARPATRAGEPGGAAKAAPGPPRTWKARRTRRRPCTCRPMALTTRRQARPDGRAAAWTAPGSPARWAGRAMLRRGRRRREPPGPRPARAGPPRGRGARRPGRGQPAARRSMQAADVVRRPGCPLPLARWPGWAAQRVRCPGLATDPVQRPGQAVRPARRAGRGWPAGRSRAGGGGAPVSGTRGAAGQPARTGTVGGPAQAVSGGGPVQASRRSGLAPGTGGAAARPPGRGWPAGRYGLAAGAARC